MPFPLIKLGYLVVKQISKPLANAIKSKAKTTPFLRNKILLPPAQFYHKMETTFKMKLLGLGKVSAVKPLNEDMAVDLAADMLGEFVIFSIASALLLAEYKRQVNKDQIKEDLQNQRLHNLEAELKNVSTKLEEQSLWLEKVATNLKISRPVIPDSEQMGSKSLIKESPDVPDKIKDSKSKIVLQVYK